MLALELFSFQYHHNELYRKYVNSLNIDPANIQKAVQIPFLPIQFFKSNRVATTEFEPEAVFESSGTTGTIPSRHFIKSLDLYQETFTRGFEIFYGNPEKLCILGLLPSYLERNNSSLVVMVNELIAKSKNTLSGFYLKDHEKLYQTLLHNEIIKQPTLLIGVTFALLDFAEEYELQLKNTIIMETGGMKGRREEMIRFEVHEILKNKFGVKNIHSEYGMTELLSQAYTRKKGKFKCPPWMKVYVRNEDDPLLIKEINPVDKRSVKGILNIIDLANLHSCAFIATDDIGSLHHDECFEVEGRIDNSDLRGCSLLHF